MGVRQLPLMDARFGSSCDRAASTPRPLPKNTLKYCIDDSHQSIHSAERKSIDDSPGPNAFTPDRQWHLRDMANFA